MADRRVEVIIMLSQLLDAVVVVAGAELGKIMMEIVATNVGASPLTFESLSKLRVHKTLWFYETSTKFLLDKCSFDKCH